MDFTINAYLNLLQLRFLLFPFILNARPKLQPS